MPDYIEFVNWPEKPWNLDPDPHPFDSMSMEDQFHEYIQLKIVHPMMSDEKLSKKVGKGVHYFTYLKKRIRSER